MNRITVFFSSIWAWIFPLIKSLSSEVGKIVLKEAITVCTEIAASMLAAKGTEKKEAAFKQIVKNLKKQGLDDISDAMINRAIETAVAYIAEKK
jgi:copper oxidase (laccase) domain-containing protein